MKHPFDCIHYSVPFALFSCTRDGLLFIFINGFHTRDGALRVSKIAEANLHLIGEEGIRIKAESIVHSDQTGLIFILLEN